MENRIVTIKNGVVSVPQSGDIRMTQHEIASLFEVYVQTVKANIKAVLKSGVIKADISCAVTIAGNTILPDVYGLDMITALAFRIHSPNAQIFREYIIRKATKIELPGMLIIPVQNPVLN